MDKQSKMKILIISHSAVVGSYQEKLSYLEQKADIELLLITPKQWPEFGKLTKLDTLTYPNIKKKALHVFFTGHPDGHFYRFSKLLKEGNIFKPDLIYFEEEPRGFVANNSYMKGHREFVEAIKLICKMSDDVQFILVGDGPSKDYYKKLAEEYSLQKRIFFTGNRNDVVQIIKLLVSVLPSLGEGLPRTVMESMASGIPVVASSVDGINELIDDGISGILVPSKDSEILKDGIIRLLENRNLANKIGEKGKQRVQNCYSKDSMISQHETIYDRMANIYLNN